MCAKLHIPDHLILPFGTKTKFNLDKVKLISVSADGIYLDIDIPVVYIDRSEKKPITFLDFYMIFDKVAHQKSKDVAGHLNYIRDNIKKYMPNPNKYELMFLDLYFEILLEDLGWGVGGTDDAPEVVFNALIPIPEMQLYVQDPLDEMPTFDPQTNFRVDFGFWTGEQLVAIEIDGAKPQDYARDLRRDRLLRRAGVDVINIHNLELERHRAQAIQQLLPKSILQTFHDKPPPDGRWPFLGRSGRFRER